MSLPSAERAAVAYYIGQQMRETGAPIDLFNLLVPLPSMSDCSIIHPVESTVSRMTLESNGIRPAPYLILGQCVMQAREGAPTACN